MDPTKMAELANYFDNTDLSAEVEESMFDDTIDPAPMVGITVRLPAAVLNKVREQAVERGVKATALIREWVEASVAEQTDDNSVVKASELRKLLSRASVTTEPGTLFQGAATVITDPHLPEVRPEILEQVTQVTTVNGQIPILKNFTVKVFGAQASSRGYVDRLGPSNWHLIRAATHSKKGK